MNASAPQVQFDRSSACFGAARGLERALLASLALHGAVLAGVSLPENAVDANIAASEPIAARIVESTPVLPQVVEELQERPAAAKPPARPASARKPAPFKQAVAEPRYPEMNSRPVATADSAAPPAAVPAPAPQPVAIASTPADPTTLREYRALLLVAAGRFKRYPDEARENNWTGSVVVGVAVGAGGTAQVGLRRSSGQAVLDRQALEMFGQAARAVPLPERLRGREFSLELRAVYGLED